MELVVVAAASVLTYALFPLLKKCRAFIQNSMYEIFKGTIFEKAFADRPELWYLRYNGSNLELVYG